MKNTILIAGDSFGVGEWGLSGTERISYRDSVVHRGLQQYIEDHGRSVINLSLPGGSNTDTYNRCIDLLENNPYYRSTIKSIVVFQTEWQRDISNYFNFTEVPNYSVEELKSRWVSRFYIRLTECSTKFNIPVYVIGGCSDAIFLSDMSKEYPGVTIACQSLTNLLINNDHRIDNPVMTAHQIRQIADQLMVMKSNSATSNDKKFVMEEIEKGVMRLNTWVKNPTWFYPDNMHANRLGHKKLFDHLCNSVPEFID
jgi:hypothetical protein